MPYRTKTYIAGDWTGDQNLISNLKFWNENSYWGLSYDDAHELTQARDTSLPCSIKKSLKERLDASKTFVLIVGAHTKKPHQRRLQALRQLFDLWTLPPIGHRRPPKFHRVRMPIRRQASPENRRPLQRMRGNARQVPRSNPVRRAAHSRRLSRRGRKAVLGCAQNQQRNMLLNPSYSNEARPLHMQRAGRRPTWQSYSL